MNETLILDDVKEQLGANILNASDAENPFDKQLLLQINTVFSILYQIGLGENPITITNLTSWHDVLGDREDLNLVKTYVYEKVRTIFDPPQGSLMTSVENVLKELEYRIYFILNRS